MSKTEFNPLISDKNDFEHNHREVIMVVGIRVVGWLLYISYIKASIYELKFLGINTFKKSIKSKGETYYEVSFPKKVTARPLTDEEIEYFMGLKPLNELLPKYGIRDFERALEGLQNFDEENEMGFV